VFVKNSDKRAENARKGPLSLAFKQIVTEIRVATAYFNPRSNRTDRVPDYFIHKTDKWLVFPHELNGLSREEILQRKPGIESIAARLKELPRLPE